MLAHLPTSHCSTSAFLVLTMSLSMRTDWVPLSKDEERMLDEEEAEEEVTHIADEKE